MLISSKPHLLIQWTTDKFKNLTKGRLYDAYTEITTASGCYIGFQILDDEGELFYLENDLNGESYYVLGGIDAET